MRIRWEKYYFLIVCLGLSWSPAFADDEKGCSTAFDTDAKSELLKKAVNPPYTYPDLKEGATEQEKCDYYNIRFLAEYSNPNFIKPKCTHAEYSGQPCEHVEIKKPECGELHGKTVSSYPLDVSKLCAVGHPLQMSVHIIFNRLKVINQDNPHKFPNVGIEELEWNCHQMINVNMESFYLKKCTAKTSPDFDVLSTMPYNWNFYASEPEPKKDNDEGDDLRFILFDGFESKIVHDKKKKDKVPVPSKPNFAIAPKKFRQKSSRDCPNKRALVCYNADKYTTTQTFYEKKDSKYEVVKTLVWRNCPLGKNPVLQDNKISCIGVFGQMLDLQTHLEMLDDKFTIPSIEDLQQLQKDGYLFDSTRIQFYWSKSYRNPIVDGKMVKDIRATLVYGKRKTNWVHENDLGLLYVQLNQ